MTVLLVLLVEPTRHIYQANTGPGHTADHPYKPDGCLKTFKTNASKILTVVRINVRLDIKDLFSHNPANLSVYLKRTFIIKVRSG